MFIFIMYVLFVRELAYVYCIDLLNDVHFKKINNNGNWAVYLKKIKNYDAMCFNYNVSRQILRIIKKSI